MSAPCFVFVGRPVREASEEAGEFGLLDGPHLGGDLGALLGDEDAGGGGDRRKGRARALDSADDDATGPPTKVPRSPGRATGWAAMAQAGSRGTGRLTVVSSARDRGGWRRRGFGSRGAHAGGTLG